MNGGNCNLPGAGWTTGNAPAALEALCQVQQLVQAAWDATPSDTASLELLSLANRWLPLHETICSPQLDEWHLRDELLLIRAVLTGAASVPDACEGAKEGLQRALELLEQVWRYTEGAAAPAAPGPPVHDFAGQPPQRELLPPVSGGSGGGKRMADAWQMPPCAVGDHRGQADVGA